MRHIPRSLDTLLIRTDFENQQAWETICRLIRAPVHDGSEMFYTYVEIFEDIEFRNLSEKDVLARVPTEYDHSFLLVVDSTAVAQPEFPFSSWTYI